MVGVLLLSGEEESSERSITRESHFDAHEALASNLLRLKRLMAAEASRKIAVIGQPGAGKSSLIISIASGLVRPRPVVSALTDATDWSTAQASVCLLRGEGNVCFIDAPGYGTDKHPADIFVDFFPFEGCDVILHVLSGKIHSSDIAVFRRLVTAVNTKAGKRPPLVLWVRSFLDAIDPTQRTDVRVDVQTQFSSFVRSRLHLVSNRTGEGLDELRSSLTLA